jgi:hypothetical protein
MDLFQENVGIFCVYLERLKAIWYILEPLANFVIIYLLYFSVVLVYCTKKNLATLSPAIQVHRTGLP